MTSTVTRKASVPVKEPNPVALVPGEFISAVPTRPVLKNGSSALAYDVPEPPAKLSIVESPTVKFK